MTTYAELRLRIDRGVAHGSYRIVATGPAGEALGRFKLPFSDLELENFILRVGSTRRGRRRIDSPEMELAKTFGTKLFGALFEGDVRELYRSSFTESRADGLGLRVTLSLTGAPELLQVPWEYLYDHPSFLSISTWTPIVRYLDLPKPRRPLQIELPLRILALVSAPSDFEAIDANGERAKLENALAPLIGTGAVAIDWLEEASLRALQRQLRKADYHVFHYIGHGGYDDEADDGVLLFEDENGRGRRVSGVQLGTILADEVSLRLAVLNSCEGGRSSIQDPFSGVATSLIEREIPAVIGMQFEITDRAAIVFAGEFYSALADGLPVDSSVAEARKAIYADQNDIEWGTPVLFMRVADGRLFDVQAHVPVRALQPELREEIAALRAADEAEEAVVANAPAATDVPVHEPSDEPAAAEPAEPAAADGANGADAADAAARERAAAAEAERAELARLQREADALAEQERVISAHVAEMEEVAEAAGREPTATAVEAGTSRAEPERQEHATADATATIETERAPATQRAVEPIAAPGWAIPEDQLRAAGRGAVGGALTMFVAWAWHYLEVDGYDVSPYLGEFLGAVLFLAGAMAVAVVVAERYVPAVRIPDGRIYSVVGGNRLAAAGIQGAIAGATIGFAVLWLFYRDNVRGDLISVLAQAAIGAVTFVVAEGLISGLWRPRGGVDAP